MLDISFFVIISVMHNILCKFFKLGIHVLIVRLMTAFLDCVFVRVAGAILNSVVGSVFVCKGPI